ncbi:MAG: DoxX family protein [Ilumatobacteraceae bacterium]
MNAYDWAVLLGRAWLGAVMLLHGLNHARSIDGTAKWFASVGFRQPRLNATLSAFGELAVGAGLVAGLLTSFAAMGLVTTMTVAFGAIHRFVGFFVFKRPDEGYEYVATLAVFAVVVATLGPGQASIDHALDLDMKLDGYVGMAIAAAGILLGALQLAAFWRKLVPKP